MSDVSPLAQLLQRLWGSVLRCPLCRRRPAGPAGCCEPCRRGLFTPLLWEDAAALGPYEGRLERAVRAFKFGGARRLATLFAPALAEAVCERGWPLDAVCSVPLHPRRQRERGFNQSEVLARALARELELPCRPLLTRTRATRQQARLGRAERFANVRGAFASSSLKGERVLLVDDVVTSGATTGACREALLAAGAREVKVAAIARAR